MTLAKNGSYLNSIDSIFARERLAQIMLIAISYEAISKSISLEEATTNLKNNKAEISIEDTLEILFQSPVEEEFIEQIEIQEKTT